jgi:hypothetical protein
MPPEILPRGSIRRVSMHCTDPDTMNRLWLCSPCPHPSCSPLLPLGMRVCRVRTTSSKNAHTLYHKQQVSWHNISRSMQ